MTLRPLFRMACVAGLALGVAPSVIAQPASSDVRVRADPYETHADAHFRSYPTLSKETQLLLDTMTGELWQVELSEPFPHPRGTTRKAQAAGRYKLTEPQPNSSIVNRFALLQHDTQVLSLLDQDHGTVWHVVVFFRNPARTTVTRLEDMPLPQVETP